MTIMARLPVPIKRHPVTRPKPKPRPRPRPAASWPSWTDGERWTTILPEPEPEAAVVSAEDEAFYLGFRLGREGEYPAPVGLDAEMSRAFYRGRLAGFTLSPEGIAWQDDMARWCDQPAGLTDADVWPHGVC